jgi:hypothetical protein
MSAPSPHPVSPPPGPVGEPQSTVRRHHTITAASRSARTAARAPISEESQEQQTWDDEEVVDPERVRSVGAVGEKGGGSLHRQASLPSRYNRGTSLALHNLSAPHVALLTIYSQAYVHSSRGSGSHTPRTLNSLSSIAGHDGEEEEWETEIRGLRNDEVLYTLHKLASWLIETVNLSRRFMLRRIYSTRPWINRVKTRRPHCLHSSAPSPHHPPAPLFGGTNRLPMVQPREWPRLASGVLGPYKTRAAHMVIILKHPALLAPRKKSQRALLAVRMSPTLPGRSQTRDNNTPPARSIALRGAPLATNGALPGEMATWLGPTTGAPHLRMFSEDYPPWILIVNIRRPPSPAHSPTPHHASIRISHSNSRHCETQDRTTVTRVPRPASCNLSRIWTSVATS